MSKGTGIWVAVLVVGAGFSQVGVARNTDGTVNPSATLEQSVDAAGNIVGDGIDSVAESAGRGAGSALSSSNVAKAATLGAGAYYGSKYAPKIKTRVSSCWSRKSCDATPATPPEAANGFDPQVINAGQLAVNGG